MSARGDLGRKSIVLFTGTWTGKGFGLLSTIIIARFLGPEAVGILGFSRASSVFSRIAHSPSIRSPTSSSASSSASPGARIAASGGPSIANHAFTDTEHDPYSSLVHGFWKIQLGNVYYYLREAWNPETLARWAKDIREDWWGPRPGHWAASAASSSP